MTGLSFLPRWGVFNAIVAEARTDGRATNRPVYLAMAVDLDGCKHVLGLWKASYTAPTATAAEFALNDNIGHHRGSKLGTHSRGSRHALNAFAVAYPGRVPDTLN